MVKKQQKPTKQEQPQRTSRPSSSTLTEGQYYVQEIVDKRIIRGKAQYQIKWLGYPSYTNTWEYPENLINLQDTIDEFEEMLRERAAWRRMKKEWDKSKKGKSSIKKVIETQSERSKQKKARKEGEEQYQMIEEKQNQDPELPEKGIKWEQQLQQIVLVQEILQEGQELSGISPVQENIITLRKISARSQSIASSYRTGNTSSPLSNNSREHNKMETNKWAVVKEQEREQSQQSLSSYQHQKSMRKAKEEFLSQKSSSKENLSDPSNLSSYHLSSQKISQSNLSDSRMLHPQLSNRSSPSTSFIIDVTPEEQHLPLTLASVPAWYRSNILSTLTQNNNYLPINLNNNHPTQTQIKNIVPQTQNKVKQDKLAISQIDNVLFYVKLRDTHLGKSYNGWITFEDLWAQAPEMFKRFLDTQAKYLKQSPIL